MSHVQAHAVEQARHLLRASPCWESAYDVLRATFPPDEAKKQWIAIVSEPGSPWIVPGTGRPYCIPGVNPLCGDVVYPNCPRPAETIAKFLRHVAERHPGFVANCLYADGWKMCLTCLPLDQATSWHFSASWPHKTEPSSNALFFLADVATLVGAEENAEISPNGVQHWSWSEGGSIGLGQAPSLPPLPVGATDIYAGQSLDPYSDYKPWPWPNPGYRLPDEQMAQTSTWGEPPNWKFVAFVGMSAVVLGAILRAVKGRGV